MKTIILLFLVFAANGALGQSAYIQITGEPGLSVYLNNQFKGKTTVEYKGYIIENVTAGKNLIKIIKDGFTPFEETITVKPGEVFAYKVKPFAKHIVNISEQGNTGETEKKTTIPTGKLVIQSVPIEIKITMPDIEGINNSPKSKDEWLADKIPAGDYKITFTYNQKTITKTIRVTSNETTSVFVNMLSGDFTMKNSLDARKEKERTEARLNARIYNFIDSICKEYKFKVRMKESEFRDYNTEAASIMTGRNRSTGSKNSYSYAGKEKNSDKGSYISFNANNDLVGYSHDIMNAKIKEYESIVAYFKNVVTTIENTIPAEFIRTGDGSISIYYPKMNIDIHYKMSFYSKTANASVFFLVVDRFSY